MRTQWSLDSKSINFGRKPLSFNFQYTGGYLCCSQWSVIRHAEFFSDYLFLCLDKSVLYSNLRHSYLNIKINNQRKTLHAWSLITESNIDSHQYTENWNLRSILVAIYVALSGQWWGMLSFSLMIYYFA